jgi:hypothetical protein
VIAPSSAPNDAKNIKWLRMRFISTMITRMYCARGGTSTSIIFSRAIHIGSSLLIPDSQSIRETRLVICL